jgi:hypothetical protein
VAETSSALPGLGAAAQARGQRGTGAATALVGLVSFAVYVVLCAPAPYLLDSAELAAASHGLGVAHPPGETVALLWGKLFTLLPLGSIAFKVALSQATAAALTAALVFRLTLRTLNTLLPPPAPSEPPPAPTVPESPSPRGPPWGEGRGEGAPDRDPPFHRLYNANYVHRALSIAAALGFALAPGVVISANRPEVYALATLLAVGALHAAGRDDPRGLLLASLLLGVGMANHPLVAAAAALGVAVALPSWLRPLQRDPSREVPRGRLLALATGALLAGLCTLAYLPARAHALFAGAPAGSDVIAWGDGRTAPGLWWIVSGRTFMAKTMVVQQNADALAAPFVIFEEVGVLAPLALIGLALGLLRRSGRRSLGSLAAAAAGALLAALRGGFDPQNPDIRGYLGLTLAALAVLGAAAVALMLGERPRPAVRHLAGGTLLLAVLLTALPRLPALSLASARAADLAGHQLLDSVPPRAAVLTSHFETAFLLSYQRAVEGRRPDVDWAHLGFVRGPGYAERLLAARPALAPLIEAQLLGVLGPRQLLADRRAVLLEAAHLEPRVLAALVPAGTLWRAALADDGFDDDGRDTTAVDGGLFHRLLPLPELAFTEAARDRQVRGFFGFRAYGDAALACARGLQDAARLRAGELMRLLPDDQRTRALLATCPAAAPAPLY